MSDEKRSDLLPCPFCGWGISFIASTSNHCVAVFCDNCLASSSPNEEGEEAAIISWQARAALDQRHEVTDEMVMKVLKAAGRSEFYFDSVRADLQSIVQALR